MYWAMIFIMIGAMCAMFACGYYVRDLKAKYGLSWLLAVPVTAAMLMFHIIWALLEMARAGRFD